MKKMTNPRSGSLCLCITVLLLAVSALSGCAKTTGASWISDYEEAEKLAAEQNRGIAVLFTGLTWDGISQQLNDAVFASDKFLSLISRDFIPVSIDIPDLSTEPDEETLKKLSVGDKFRLERTPMFFLTTSDGIVVDSVSFDDPEMESNAAFSAVKESIAQAKKIAGLRKKIEKADGVKKAGLLADMVDLIDPMFQDQVVDQIKEAVSLDPENTTGKMGRLRMLNAYADASELFGAGKVEDAVNVFVTLAENEQTLPVEKQEAYHNAAYINAMAGSDTATIVDFLQKSYDAAPEEDGAASILELIGRFQEEDSQAQ